MAPAARTWLDDGAGAAAPDEGFGLSDEKEVTLWQAVSAVKIPIKITTKRIAIIWYHLLLSTSPWTHHRKSPTEELFRSPVSSRKTVFCAIKILCEGVPFLRRNSVRGRKLGSQSSPCAGFACDQ